MYDNTSRKSIDGTTTLERPSLPMEGPSFTNSGITDVEFCYLLGENQGWSVNDRGEILAHDGGLLAPDVLTLFGAVSGLSIRGRVVRDGAYTEMVTGVRWDLFDSNDRVELAHIIRATLR